jgi:hypothetical protein
MLSAVLNSVGAVEMSILVVDAFVRMRELMASNKYIAVRVEKLERGRDRSAYIIEILVEDIDRLAHEVKEMKAFPPVTRSGNLSRQESHEGNQSPSENNLQFRSVSEVEEALLLRHRSDAGTKEPADDRPAAKRRGGARGARLARHPRRRVGLL